MASETVLFEVAEAGKVKESRAISFRETKAHRVARVTQLFAAYFPLVFLSAFAGKMAHAFVQGKMVEFPDREKASREAPHVLLCPVCNKYHGEPVKGSPEVSEKNLYLNAIFRTASGSAISLSQTCLDQYVLPLAKVNGKGDIRKAILNLDKFVLWYPQSELAKEYRRLDRK